MTMGEVLEVMLAKARVEAEDAQVGGWTVSRVSMC